MYKAAKRYLTRTPAPAPSDRSQDPLARSPLEERIAKFNLDKPKVEPELQRQVVDTRAAQRFAPAYRETYLTLRNGKKVDARIINISMLGAAIEAPLDRFNPADVVMVGSRRVQLGRKIMLGVVFLFDRPLDASICTRSLIL